WIPVISLQQLGGLCIVYYLAVLWIIDELPATELHGNICQNAACSGDVTRFNVGDGSSFLSDGFQEVEHMQARCRRRVQFDPVFGEIFRIFFLLIDDVFVDLRSISNGSKITFHSASPQGSFLAVEHEGPWVFRISGCSPCAVLPDA